MRITFIQSSLWLSGGARVVVEFANRLNARQHEVSVVIPKGAISEELAKEISPAVAILEANYTLTKSIGLLGKMRLTYAMVQAIKPCDVIVSTHTPTTLVSFFAGSILRRGVPVWLYQDYPGMFAERPFEGWLLRNALRWHKAALVVSNHLKEDLSSFSQGTILYVGEGLSHVHYLKPTQRSEIQAASSRRSIFYLGDFRPRKGLVDFLAAARLVAEKVPDIELWVATKEPGEVQTDLPVRFIFRPSQELLAELYATCDLFVSASWYEGFGLPPLEAMACGAPVVMTDSGGVRDFASPENNCLLVPPRKPEQLAQAMQRVLEDGELAARLRLNGPPTAAQFSWENATDRFEQALFTIYGS